MLKFSANVTMMFNEITDPIERIKAAKKAGFNAVEFIFIYDMPWLKCNKGSKALLCVRKA